MIKFTDTHKWCPRCQEMLPHEDFYVQKSAPTGLSQYCKKSSREATSIRKIA